LDQLMGLSLVRRFHDEAVREHPRLPGLGRRRLLSEVLRRLLSAQVHDLVGTTRARLARARPANAWQARQGAALVAFSPAMRANIIELKRFLFRALYRHEQVQSQTQRGKVVVQDLFEAYAQRPSEMPAEYGLRPDTHRAVADYVAGMTDRFALREHERLTGQRVFA
jgi:dGTPase